MTKFAFVGAGSTVFAKNLMTDVLQHEAFAEATFALHDIDAERLATSERVVRRVASLLGRAPTIFATTDRERALDGADYVVLMIQVGGYEPATVTDFEVPKRYGLEQTIGDTLGIGGIFRALRTIPVVLDIARDIERLAPDALLLQYVNPMAMLGMALDRATNVRHVGLCHSVQSTVEKLATDVGVPAAEVDYACAGINHLAFFTKLEHRGRDLYPELHRAIAEDRVPEWNRVRYDVLRHLGHFVTESSEHFAEYVPWYFKADRPDLIERFAIPIDEYPRRCREQIAEWRTLRDRLEDPDHPLSVEPSHEYAATIVHAETTGTPAVIHGNVPNRGLIEGLPEGACVEVACLVDRNGVQPTRVGALPRS